MRKTLTTTALAAAIALAPAAAFADNTSVTTPTPGTTVTTTTEQHDSDKTGLWGLLGLLGLAGLIPRKKTVAAPTASHTVDREVRRTPEVRETRTAGSTVTETSGTHRATDLDGRTTVEDPRH